MSGRGRALLVDIGDGVVAAPTPPLTVAASWVPAVYTPPPLDTPTGLATLSIADAAVLSWTPTTGCETVIETAPDNAGSPGAWTIRAQTVDGAYTLPVPYGTVRWVRIKAVRYGRNSAWSAPALAAALMFGAGPGRNLIGNPSFEINTLTDTGVAKRSGLLCNLWTVTQSTAPSSYVKRVQDDGNTSGLFAAEVQLSGSTLANGALLFSDRCDYIPSVDLLTQQAFVIRAKLTCSGSGSLLGCAVVTNVAVIFFNAAGGYLGAVAATQSAQNFTGVITAKGLVPAGAKTKQLILQGYVANATGSSQNLAGEMFRMRVDDVELIPITNLDTDVEDGTTHGRIAMADTYAVSGVNRLGVAVSTSGQQVTARNMPATATASVGSLWDGLTLTSSYAAGDPSVVTVNASAATLRASGASPAYTAASAITTQDRGTTVRYYAYYLDATQAGGTKTLMLSTQRLDVVNGAGIVFLDSIPVTVPTFGAGSGGAGSNVGGGGGLLP